MKQKFILIWEKKQSYDRENNRFRNWNYQLILNKLEYEIKLDISKNLRIDLKYYALGFIDKNQIKRNVKNGLFLF